MLLIKLSGTKAMAKILWVFSLYTVNGRYYYLITFVFPSLRLGTRDVRTSSSLCSSAVSHPSSHTVNGKCCCNKGMSLVSQCYLLGFNTVNGRYCCNTFSEKESLAMANLFQYRKRSTHAPIRFIIPMNLVKYW